MLFAELLSNALGQMLGELLGEALEHKLDRRLMLRALSAAVARAEERFAQEYRAQDAELADALTTQTRFADLPSVRAALRELLTRPFHDPALPTTTLRQSFADVLPERLDRTRVDAAVQAFLGYLGQEVLYIPQLRELYALLFHKLSAESSRRMADDTAALVQSMHGLREDMRQLTAEPARAALPPATQAERPRPWHNLPQRSYTRFVGRQAELGQLTRLLLPHPRSRHFVVTLDGIGGVGKSALALELAYRYREGYAASAPEERFEAIVWVSAKRTLLTAGGIQTRQQTFSTLSDLYREIATMLEQPAILQSDAAQRRALVERALAHQRTLLIVDNLETVDDEELLSFLREIPDPAKVIVTTRHRIDIAYTIRLSGMPESDAQALMLVEAARKGVDLPVTAMDDLYRRSGGIPLAIVWSIGLMSLGHSVESVLRRLGSAQSDIARFCFAESVARIRERDAYTLLLALALFESHVSRQMLGEVAGLGDDVIGRDDGLAELLQLSLVEQKGERFFLLPLTQSYVLEELARQPKLEQELREQWIVYLKEMTQPYTGIHWQKRDRRLLKQEGIHLVSLAAWCQEKVRPDILLQILPALSLYYDTVGEWNEMFKLGQIGLENARLLGDEQSILYIGTSVIYWILSYRGQYEEAEQVIADTLAMSKQIKDIAWQCKALLLSSQSLSRRRAFEQAKECCYQVRGLSELLAEPQRTAVQANIEYELGKIARDQGDLLDARVHFLTLRDAFGWWDEIGTTFDVERAWESLGELAFVMHQLGELDDAAQLYRLSLDFCREIGGKGNVTVLLLRLATLEEQRGNQAAALDYAREAREWSGKLGMVEEQAQAQALIGRLSAQQQ